MEQVINAQDRNFAFGKFLVFFSITVAIIVAAVHFDTLIPQHENDQLRKEISNIKDQRHVQEQFVTAINQVISLTDSLNKLGRSHPLVEREITEQLRVLNSPRYQESSLFGSLNKEVFNLIYDYTETNKKLLYLNKDLQEMDRLRAELIQAKSDLKEAEMALDILRRNNN